MADGTRIEWTDATWNPITGCSVVSAGCKHCYAMKLAGTRLKHTPSREGLTIETKAGPVWNGQVRFNEQWLDQPLRWRRSRRIFVCAHGDLFHESVPDEWIDRVFAVMASASWHTFQVLTKRPARALAYLRAIESEGPARLRHYVDVEMAESRAARQALSPPMSEPPDPTPELRTLYDRAAANRSLNEGKRGLGPYGERHWRPWPLSNVWLGVSVEDQAAADERIPLLLQCPAAVRWISAEPLLGPIDLTCVASRSWAYGHGTRSLDSLTGEGVGRVPDEPETRVPCYYRGIDWVVAGGESGSGARPMHPGWARSLRDQCAAAGVPFLFKQWGAWRPITEGAQDWYDSLYRSRRRARDGESQDVLDDVWGRECTVENIVVHGNGTTHPVAGPNAFKGPDPFMTFRVGKKAAGRLLDGVQHDGYPEARP